MSDDQPSETGRRAPETDDPRALDQIYAWGSTDAGAGVMAVIESGSAPTLFDRIGPDRTLPWASVTKLLVAVASLVACEEGTIALDDPAGPPSSTVGHLLAHASGLGLEGTDPVASPGSRRIYSNSGFEILAELISRRSSMSFADYLAQGVLEPLHMGSTTLREGSSPAWGATGPLSDLLLLAEELLAPSLVSPATLERATAPAFGGLDGVLPGFGLMSPCDWGLGFEIRGSKHPHWTGSANSTSTFGHFGRSGSFLWVDPVARVACAALSGRRFGAWALGAWPRLSDAVLDEVSRS